jgi:hypothetical protein
MAQHKQELESLGASLCAIGNGNALMARDFVEQFSVEFPVYTDPSRQTYQWLEFKRPYVALDLGVFKRGRRAGKAGFRQGAVAGDVFQQGGEIIVSPDGALLYSRASSGPGDHAPVEELLAVLRDPGESSSQ